jgi:uncharacterized protein
MFHRSVNIPEKRSFFLFGARGTGKSTLLRNHFSKSAAHEVNLLDLATEARLLRNPEFLESEILNLPEHVTHVVIDEIQKVPKLLDCVHNLIETHQSKKAFVLTGSSARKLKLGGANLLAGRAALRNLFPLTWVELGEAFRLSTYLQWGGLPALWNSIDTEARQDMLTAYAQVYLKEEIWAEQLVRNLDGFRHFAEVAAQGSGKLVNFSKIGREAGVDTKSAQAWYQILEDTLLGFFLNPFHTSVRKSLKQAPKFYFFDVGVARALAHNLSIVPQEGTSYFGELFEQFVVNQFYVHNQYQRLDYQFFYLMTKSGVEVDLIVKRPGKPLALVEIKSTRSIKPEHWANLEHFGKDFPDAHFYLLSQDPIERKVGQIQCVPWNVGLQII